MLRLRFRIRRRVTVVLPRAADEVWDARPAEDADGPAAAGRDAADDPSDAEIGRRRRLRQRVLGFVLSVVFLAGTAALLFGERGFLDVRRSRAELEVLQRQVDGELAALRDLRDELERLKTDPAAIERIAREELGFSRRGEVQFLLPRSDSEPGAGDRNLDDADGGSGRP